MASRRSAGGDSFHIEAQEFSQLLNDAKRFDKELAKALRKEIRAAAKPVVADVKREVKALPTSGQYGSGVRAKTARGVGLRISAAKRGGSVTIVAADRNLPPRHKAMSRLLNREKWRRPVGKSKQTWIWQRSTPYFEPSILRHRAALRRAVEDALDKAATALGRNR